MPFDSMTLSMTPGQPGTLSVEMTPLRELFDLYPRTLAQAFYDDGQGMKNFFEGELVGHGFTKDAEGRRQMSLTFQDLSNYWMTTYAFFLKQGQIDLPLSLTDEVPLFTGLDPAQVNEKRLAERVFPIRGIGDIVTQLFVGRNKDMVAGLRDMMKAVSASNAFYQDRFSRLKLSERLFSMPDGQIKFLVDPEASSVMRDILYGMEPFTPVLGVIDTLLTIIYHSFWSLSIPSVDPKTQKPINFALIPPTFLTAPPRCNVVFPDQHMGFGYGRNLMDEPTRMSVALGTSFDGNMQFYFSPPGFRNKVKEIRIAQAKNQALGFQQLLVADPNPELDERVRGIVPERRSLKLDVFSRVRAAILRSTTNQQQSKDAANRLIQGTIERICDYEFLRRKFENRAFPLAMPFNPNIHPAFPVLVLDSEARLFGTPQSVVHRIDSSGNASTALQCVMARHKDVIGDVVADLPPWINHSFAPDAIGEDASGFSDLEGKSQTVQGAYPGMIGGGMRSILSQNLPVYDKTRQVDDRKPKSQEDAANMLFDVYHNSGDRDAFVGEYTRRPIQSMDQALAFLGVTKVNAESLDGTIYDAVKRGIVEGAKKRLVDSGRAFVEV